jgi:SAM-dependent methyltransferase
MTRTAEEIKQAVQESYGARAREVARSAEDASSCCGPSVSAKGIREKLYVSEEVGELPETAVSYGCGNPTAIAGLRPGEVVLDLGSGAGLDCFVAAKAVGPAGQVIGLDMTPDMLDLANANKAKLGVANVEFRRGEMEDMPVESGTVNAIISNCVINLSPDKDAVFRESFRVLKPGGRFHVSDVVLARELAEGERDDLALWAGCASGALLEDDYLKRLVGAGFSDVRVDTRSAIRDKPWYSVTVSAYKQAKQTTCC